MRQISYSSAIDGAVNGELQNNDALLPLHEPQPGMSLSQVVAILRFYWKYIAIIAAAIAVISAGAIKFLPKTYTATATLIVDPGKTDPLAVVANLPGEQMTSYVETQVELIQSPLVLLRVVDQMHLTSDETFNAGFTGSNEDALREYTEKNLADSLRVDLGRGGELLYISAAARSSVEAANIANTVADSYIEEEKNRSSGPAAERAQRYAADLTQLRAKVSAAQDALTAFLQQRGITDLDTSANATDTQSQALKSLEEHLLDAQNERRALEAKSTGEESVADESLASHLIEQLKTQLSDQQTALAQLSVTDGPRNPKVIAVKNQIALTQRQLNNATRTLSANTETELQRAKELESSYTRAVAAQRTKVMNLREQQGQGAKLMLELESAQSVYKQALDGYDQFMFASANDKGDVSLVSRATPPVRATSPNKPKLMLMGVLVGLGFGVALPFAYELIFSRRLRCRDDIERSFGIPVLAQLDSIVATSNSA